VLVVYSIRRISDRYPQQPLAVARALQSGELDLRVHPALVAKSDPLAHINGALNAVHIEGAALGWAILEELTARGTLTIGTTHLGTLNSQPRTLGPALFAPAVW
jgi:hypothetical protein